MSSNLWEENGIRDANERNIQRSLKSLRESKEVSTFGKNKGAKHYLADFRESFSDTPSQASF
jgi:hypothetical protein